MHQQQPDPRPPRTSSSGEVFRSSTLSPSSASLGFPTAMPPPGHSPMVNSLILPPPPPANLPAFTRPVENRSTSSPMEASLSEKSSSASLSRKGNSHLLLLDPNVSPSSSQQQQQQQQQFLEVQHDAPLPRATISPQHHHLRSPLNQSSGGSSFSSSLRDPQVFIRSGGGGSGNGRSPGNVSLSSSICSFKSGGRETVATNDNSTNILSTQDSLTATEDQQQDSIITHRVLAAACSDNTQNSAIGQGSRGVIPTTTGSFVSDNGSITSLSGGGGGISASAIVGGGGHPLLVGEAAGARPLGGSSPLDGSIYSVSAASASALSTTLASTPNQEAGVTVPSPIFHFNPSSPSSATRGGERTSELLLSDKGQVVTSSSPGVHAPALLLNNNTLSGATNSSAQTSSVLPPLAHLMNSSDAPPEILLGIRSNFQQVVASDHCGGDATTTTTNEIDRGGFSRKNEGTNDNAEGTRSVEDTGEEEVVNVPRASAGAEEEQTYVFYNQEEGNHHPTPLVVESSISPTVNSISNTTNSTSFGYYSSRSPGILGNNTLVEAAGSSSSTSQLQQQQQQQQQLGSSSGNNLNFSKYQQQSSTTLGGASSEQEGLSSSSFFAQQQQTNQQQHGSPSTASSCLVLSPPQVGGGVVQGEEAAWYPPPLLQNSEIRPHGGMVEGGVSPGTHQHPNSILNLPSSSLSEDFPLGHPPHRHHTSRPIGGNASTTSSNQRSDDHFVGGDRVNNAVSPAPSTSQQSVVSSRRLEGEQPTEGKAVVAEGCDSDALSILNLLGNLSPTEEDNQHPTSSEEAVTPLSSSSRGGRMMATPPQHLVLNEKTLAESQRQQQHQQQQQEAQNLEEVPASPMGLPRFSHRTPPSSRQGEEQSFPPDLGLPPTTPQSNPVFGEPSGSFGSSPSFRLNQSFPIHHQYYPSYSSPPMGSQPNPTGTSRGGSPSSRRSSPHRPAGHYPRPGSGSGGGHVRVVKAMSLDGSNNPGTTTSTPPNLLEDLDDNRQPNLENSQNSHSSAASHSRNNTPLRRTASNASTSSARSRLMEIISSSRRDSASAVFVNSTSNGDQMISPNHHQQQQPNTIPTCGEDPSSTTAGSPRRLNSSSYDLESGERVQEDGEEIKEAEHGVGGEEEGSFQDHISVQAVASYRRDRY